MLDSLVMFQMQSEGLFFFMELTGLAMVMAGQRLVFQVTESFLRNFIIYLRKMLTFPVATSAFAFPTSRYLVISLLN